ncbi:MAG: D-lyxose/D-mannose family sugar isomerase [Christensenella hongkongensis]|uniref:D-lyxose/D-mannose family sugar isomerase n=1 Tax=Christensenella hongkongensis TaxID=270498 RepID=UPI002A760C48|nr:D-lyxose/D-mannose family sugar isomerase [Christensenella hongkongensis]MDY3003081.1 D-lyxose/D-mannose family sugar isomerase [Christensenella hongkongensis]
MKRSEINRKIRQGKAFLERMNFVVPPFVLWSPDEWKEKGHEYDEIRDCMLGWDITDFGTGDFDKTGLLVITLRNGIDGNPDYFKTYAEKCLIVQDGQVTPMHFHFFKMEDIINRGGADLMIKLYHATPERKLADTPVTAYVDGKRFQVPAGTVLRLKPGEGITLPPYQYHTFWAEGGTALIMEVSRVNDDNTDNHFLDAPARFPKIEEDEMPLHLLFSEYPDAK